MFDDGTLSALVKEVISQLFTTTETVDGSEVETKMFYEDFEYECNDQNGQTDVVCQANDGSAVAQEKDITISQFDIVKIEFDPSTYLTNDGT
jgi:hypothetical protein